MHTLSASEILHLWEWGQGQHPIDQALSLLTSAYPEWTREELAALSIGRRDALLLSLWERTFGPRLDCFAQCAQCGEELEFTVNVAELSPTEATEPREPDLALAAEGWEVRFRLPNSLDLAAVAHCDDVDDARNLLVHRCLLSASQADTEVEAEALPDAVIAALAAEMSEQDTLSEVRLDLQCPACRHVWPMVLDIVPFFWAEISAQAKRLLGEVHALARAYGWREADILAMSAPRRQRYLEMLT